IRETLRDQVTGTVRWADCMQRLIDLRCDFFIELGPGNVLAGLLKRTNRTIPVISVGDAESVGKCGGVLSSPSVIITERKRDAKKQRTPQRTRNRSTRTRCCTKRR